MDKWFWWYGAAAIIPLFGLAGHIDADEWQKAGLTGLSFTVIQAIKAYREHGA